MLLRTGVGGWLGVLGGKRISTGKPRGAGAEWEKRDLKE